MKVLCFAKVRDLAGAGEIDVDVPVGASVSELRCALARSVPALSQLLPKCAVAVNDEYAGDAVEIKPGDRVALLPPVSGG